LVGVDTGKHTLYARLKGDEGMPEAERLIHFNQDLDEDYYKMLTAEVFDPEKNRWVLRKGRRNESLDTWIYGVAASHHPEIRAHTMRQMDWDRLEQQLWPKPNGEVTQEAQADVPVREPMRPNRQQQRPKRGSFVKGF
jgi:phage terminase large subunit GpA-like protein